MSQLELRNLFKMHEIFEFLGPKIYRTLKIAEAFFEVSEAFSCGSNLIFQRILKLI